MNLIGYSGFFLRNCDQSHDRVKCHFPKARDAHQIVIGQVSFDTLADPVSASSSTPKFQQLPDSYLFRVAASEPLRPAGGYIACASSKDVHPKACQCSIGAAASISDSTENGRPSQAFTRTDPGHSERTSRALTVIRPTEPPA